MFRRYLMFVGSLVLCGTIVLPAPVFAMIADGDVAPFGARDGMVNVGDALVCLRFALGLETPTSEDKLHADVAPLNVDGQPDPDGVVNVGDALVILRKAVGLERFIGIDPITSNLPDTGQIKCYGSSENEISCTGTGQDGEFIINPMIYTDNGNGTVTDNITDLVWQQSDDNLARPWQAAMDYCSSYSPDGSTWRLPSVNELQNIVDAGALQPSVNSSFVGTNSSYYWSSTSDSFKSNRSWLVDFYSGAVTYGFNSSNRYYVRCVR